MLFGLDPAGVGREFWNVDWGLWALVGPRFLSDAHHGRAGKNHHGGYEMPPIHNFPPGAPGRTTRRL